MIALRDCRPGLPVLVTTFELKAADPRTALHGRRGRVQGPVGPLFPDDVVVFFPVDGDRPATTASVARRLLSRIDDPNWS